MINYDLTTSSPLQAMLDILWLWQISNPPPHIRAA